MKRKISKINYRKNNLEHYNLDGKKRARICKYTCLYKIFLERHILKNKPVASEKMN